MNTTGHAHQWDPVHRARLETNDNRILRISELRPIHMERQRLLQRQLFLTQSS